MLLRSHERPRILFGAFLTRPSLAALPGLVLVVALLAACSVFPKTPEETPFIPPSTPTPAPGTLVTVKRGTIVDTLKVRGRVVAANEALLAFKQGGFIKSIQFGPGERVTKGQPMVELDASDQEFSVSQAQYELQVAQLEADRSKAAEISQAQTRVESSKKKGDRTDLELQRLDLQVDTQDAEVEASRAATELQRQIMEGAWQMYQAIAYQNNEASAKALAAYQNAQIAYKDSEVRYKRALAAVETLKLSRKDLEFQKSINAQETAVLEQELTIVRREAQLASSIAQAKVNNLKAKVAREQAKLGEMKLTSPLSGVVVSTDARVGDKVDPFQIVGAVADPSVLLVEANVLQADIEKISIQQPGSVMLDAFPNERYQAVVKEIASQPTLWQGKNAYAITLAFKESSNVPATIRMGADIYLVTKRKDNVLLVPKVAIRSDGASQYVEVVEEGNVRRQTIEIGVTSETDAEVLTGIKEGQVIRIPS